MARAVLGALVTNLAGSIGGTQFRRTANGLVVSNKSRGTTRNRALFNDGVRLFANMAGRWAELSDIERTNWADAAQLFQFPDRFGTLRNLNGRQLFFKLAGLRIKTNGSIPNPLTLNSTISPVTLISGQIDKQGGVITYARLSFQYTGSIRVQIQVQRVNGPWVAPVFNNRFQVFSDDFPVSVPPENKIIDFSNQFNAAYGVVEPGQWWYIYFRCVNTSGFPSPWYSLLVQSTNIS